MAKKQAIAKETAAAAAPATPARTAKPRAPRVKAAQHSKMASNEPATAVQASPDDAFENENTDEAIAKIAYGYWESRGCQGGSAIEDWVRAEHEYHQRAAAARL